MGVIDYFRLCVRQPEIYKMYCILWSTGDRKLLVGRVYLIQTTDYGDFIVPYKMVT